MTDLERRALMGDRQAQEECTKKGVVLPCWRCLGEAEVKEIRTPGKPLYAVCCKKHYCGAYGCAHKTKKEALAYWNTRTAPPIGRCRECVAYIDNKCANTGYYKPESGFCNDFKSKDGEENGTAVD